MSDVVIVVMFILIVIQMAEKLLVCYLLWKGS